MGRNPGHHNGTCYLEKSSGLRFSHVTFGADGVQPQLWRMILLKSYRVTLLSSCAATFRRFRAMVNLANETASSRLILAAWLVGWLISWLVMFVSQLVRWLISSFSLFIYLSIYFVS